MDDAPLAFELYGDAEVTRYIGGAPEADLAAMRERLTRIVDRDQGFPEGMGSFPCFSRRDGELVGVALIKPLPDADDVRSDDIEIGWHVRRSRWGQGFATEMGRVLVEFGFGHHDLDVLHIVVEPPNTASLAVARKLGAEPQGRTRRYYGGRELEHLLLRR